MYSVNDNCDWRPHDQLNLLVESLVYVYKESNICLYDIINEKESSAAYRIVLPMMLVNLRTKQLALHASVTLKPLL